MLKSFFQNSFATAQNPSLAARKPHSPTAGTLSHLRLEAATTAAYARKPSLLTSLETEALSTAKTPSFDATFGGTGQ